jgi:hypothetical protein
VFVVVWVLYKIHCIQVNDQHRVREYIPEIFEIGMLDLREILGCDLLFIVPSSFADVFKKDVHISVKINQDVRLREGLTQHIVHFLKQAELNHHQWKK